MNAEVRAGRVWKFGHDINTDLIMPSYARTASLEEQVRAVFAANRPGWVGQVSRGDFLIAGRNFGIGSSRPGARSLRNLGIGCLLAESINGLFFRNCVNFGMLALECPGVCDAFEEGQTAELRLTDFIVANRETSATLSALPVPDALLNLMRSGGILPMLEDKGLIEPVGS
jgi:3-isopropylmalate/(R)-2-methylmalate dehydratase small subunit